jgi:hypothetical protein
MLSRERYRSLKSPLCALQSETDGDVPALRPLNAQPCWLEGLLIIHQSKPGVGVAY